MTRICLILVYFGPWPSYFELFKRSVAWNNTIEFLCVTDNIDDAGSDPQNFTRINMTLNEFSELASEKLDFAVHIGAPYKICDLKPMFGKIFEDRIADYGFWGHCDCDLVWGNLRKFLSENLLARFDKVLMNGHLSLYANSELGRNLYAMGSGDTDWKKALSEAGYVNFDEWLGIFPICKSRGIQYFHNDDVAADISHQSYRISAYNSLDIKHQVYYLQDGSIYRTDGHSTNEFAYIHMQKRKFPRPDIGLYANERIYFTPAGFLGGADKPLSLAELDQINPAVPPDRAGIWPRIMRRFAHISRRNGA